MTADKIFLVFAEYTFVYEHTLLSRGNIYLLQTKYFAFLYGLLKKQQLWFIANLGAPLLQTFKINLT